MPILTLATNQELTASDCDLLLDKSMTMLADLLRKPKASIMIKITPGAHLMMGEIKEPSAHLKLKLFSFPENRADEFVKALTWFVETELGVAPNLQCIELIDLVPSMFGWDGSVRG